MRDLKDETQLLEGAKQLLKSYRFCWVSKKSRKFRKVQMSDTKERKKCSCRLRIGEPGGYGSSSGRDNPGGRMVLLESWPRAGAWWQLSIEDHTCANAWFTTSCRGLFRRVDRGETILMMGSPAGDEVAKNLVGKSCRQQEVLMVEVTSNSDTTIDGLSELTMRQNPIPKNSGILYGSKPC